MYQNYFKLFTKALIVLTIIFMIHLGVSVLIDIYSPSVIAEESLHQINGNANEWQEYKLNEKIVKSIYTANNLLFIFLILYFGYRFTEKLTTLVKQTKNNERK